MKIFIWSAGKVFSNPNEQLHVIPHTEFAYKSFHKLSRMSTDLTIFANTIAGREDWQSGKVIVYDPDKDWRETRSRWTTES